MKILVDIRGIRDGFKGGIGEYTSEIISYLTKKSRYEYTLLSSGFFKNKERYLDSIKEINIPHSNKILNFSLKFFSRPYLDYFKKENFDLVFMPNINITSIRKKTPYIVTIHDLSFEIYPEVYSIKMRLWHKFINPKELIINASKIIAVSESTKQDIMDIYNIESNKIDVIYPGISTQFIETNDISDSNISYIKQKYKLPNKYLLYLGTIEPRKNISFIIRAFNKIADKYPELNLVIAGKDGWLYKDINKIIQKSKFKERIFKIGFVNVEDKAYIYRMAHIFVYPSLYEGFGFPPLEAMASGVPTIVSGISSLPEIVENSALKISPYNKNELIWAIEYFLNNPSEYERYKILGKKQAQKFKWDITASKTLKVMNKFMTKH